MKRFLVLFVVVALGCGGRLTDEERKKLHDGMSSMDIKRVSDADLQIAATDYAQRVLKEMDRTDPTLSKKSKTDSVSSVFNVRIFRLVPSDSALREIEKMLVDAYVSGGNAQQAGENIQKVGEDSLLFTKPVFKETADGSQFDYAIGIKMATRTVVLSMPKP